MKREALFVKREDTKYRFMGVADLFSLEPTTPWPLEPLAKNCNSVLAGQAFFSGYEIRDTLHEIRDTGFWEQRGSN